MFSSRAQPLPALFVVDQTSVHPASLDSTVTVAPLLVVVCVEDIPYNVGESLCRVQCRLVHARVTVCV